VEVVGHILQLVLWEILIVLRILKMEKMQLIYHLVQFQWLVVGTMELIEMDVKVILVMLDIYGQEIME